MPITVECPACSAKLTAPDDKAGKGTRCPKCGNAILVPGPARKTPQLPPINRPGSMAGQPKPPPAPVSPSIGGDSGHVEIADDAPGPSKLKRRIIPVWVFAAVGGGVLLIALIVTVVILATRVQPTGPVAQPPATLRLPGPEEKLIPYEVLSQRRSNGKLEEYRDRIQLNVLVSEKATKEEVMRLAEWLRVKNEGRRLLLSVFDSKEVWEYLSPGDTAKEQAAWDRKYGTKEKQAQMEKESKRHDLAGIGVDTNGKVVWTAKGRDH